MEKSKRVNSPSIEKKKKVNSKGKKFLPFKERELHFERERGREVPSGRIDKSGSSLSLSVLIT